MHQSEPWSLPTRCFLLRLEYANSVLKHMLIDFGTTGLPKDAASDRLTEIANDIAEKCKGNGRLDAVVATHRHAGHISGFATKANGKGSGDIIRGLRPKVVVQPWTEDPAAATDATAPTALAHKSLRSHALGLNAMHKTAEKVLEQLDSGRGAFTTATAERIRFIGEDNLANKSAVHNLATMGERPPVYTYHGGPSGLGRFVRALAPTLVTPWPRIWMHAPWHATAGLECHPSPRPSRGQEGGESPSVVRIAGRKQPSSNPAYSVRGGARLVKAKPNGWPSPSLDKPPATASFITTACSYQRTVNEPIAGVKNYLTNESS